MSKPNRNHRNLVDLAKWTQAFRADKKGSLLTRDIARHTFHCLQQFSQTAAGRKLFSVEVTPENITSKQLRRYLEFCKVDDLGNGKQRGARTVQNIASHFRRAIMGAGRELGDLKNPVNDWSSERLGLEKGTRIGTRVPMSSDNISRAMDNLETRERTALELQDNFGFRKNEAVHAGVDIMKRELEKAIELGKERTYLTVYKGTKGGKVRQFCIDSSKFEKGLDLINRVTELQSKANGHLIDRPDLAKAYEHYTYVTRKFGLTKDDSCHGARRRFAERQYDYYISQGLPMKTVLSLLSRDLGHGDGRGQWVLNNYLPHKRGG